MYTSLCIQARKNAKRVKTPPTKKPPAQCALEVALVERSAELDAVKAQLASAQSELHQLQSSNTELTEERDNALERLEVAEARCVALQGLYDDLHKDQASLMKEKSLLELNSQRDHSLLAEAQKTTAEHVAALARAKQQFEITDAARLKQAETLQLTLREKAQCQLHSEELRTTTTRQSNLINRLDESIKHKTKELEDLGQQLAETKAKLESHVKRSEVVAGIMQVYFCLFVCLFVCVCVCPNLCLELFFSCH